MSKRAFFAFLISLGLALTGCTTNPTTEQQESTSSSNQINQDSQVTFDPLAEAEALFDELDGAAGQKWMIGGEDPYEGMPILIAFPESAWDDPNQGCIVTAWDPADYDYFQRLEELESWGANLPGQGIWMGASRGLDVELRTFNMNTDCLEPTKERLGWGASLAPTFVFSDGSNGSGSSSGVEQVYMPSLIGLMHKDVSLWLKANGYDFSLLMESKRIDGKLSYNRSTACMFEGKQYVFDQEPAPGTIVDNSFTVNVRAWVDCEIRQ